MKNISLILIALFLFGCGPDYGPKKKNTTVISHDYEEGPEFVPRASDLETEDQEELYTLYRDLWQNPLLVIQRLGDLEGKTLADIGAGPYGYFSMLIASRTKIGRVIAIDIDPEAIKFMDHAKDLLPDTVQNRIETRLVTPDDARIQKEEVDIILIVNTAVFFEDRIDYFKSLLPGLSEDGKLVIIDFKMRNTPVGPSLDERIPLGQMESDLLKAGYQIRISDDRSLDFQYIVVAEK
ncbi:MAG: methyltransferase domain-containing protein [Saprospiraceae bacterium]|nr:methyltransferase domain-containing protein [Saprospiraceae bacterium]